jgi:hypothetical protein
MIRHCLIHPIEKRAVEEVKVASKLFISFVFVAADAARRLRENIHTDHDPCARHGSTFKCFTANPYQWGTSDNRPVTNISNNYPGWTPTSGTANRRQPESRTGDDV